MNKYSYTEQKSNWFYKPTYNGFASSYHPESMIVEDLESIIETQLEHPSPKQVQQRRLYYLCALTSVALLGLSFFSQIPQLSRTAQETQHSVSADLLQLMNY